ncbi:hypothetical protein Tco_0573211 [Tanacetum coccineum]
MEFLDNKVFNDLAESRSVLLGNLESINNVLPKSGSAWNQGTNLLMLPDSSITRFLITLCPLVTAGHSLGYSDLGEFNERVVITPRQGGNARRNENGYHHNTMVSI